MWPIRVTLEFHLLMTGIFFRTSFDKYTELPPPQKKIQMPQYLLPRNFHRLSIGCFIYNGGRLCNVVVAASTPCPTCQQVEQVNECCSWKGGTSHTTISLPNPALPARSLSTNVGRGRGALRISRTPYTHPASPTILQVGGTRQVHFPFLHHSTRQLTDSMIHDIPNPRIAAIQVQVLRKFF